MTILNIFRRRKRLAVLTGDMDQPVYYAPYPEYSFMIHSIAWNNEQYGNMKIELVLVGKKIW
jgi:hypothetical protein